MNGLFKLFIKKGLILFGIKPISKKKRNFNRIIIGTFEILENTPKIIFDVRAHTNSFIERFIILFRNLKIFFYKPNTIHFKVKSLFNAKILIFLIRHRQLGEVS